MISAIWLILLGAAIVSVISLTVLNNAQLYAQERDNVRSRLAIESAYETVVADILFNGPRSNFAALPASTDYNLTGVSMKVEVSSENGKLDVNSADPALIERALMGLGVASANRSQFLNFYRLRREQSKTLLSIADIEAEMQSAGIISDTGSSGANAICISQFFTAHSGLAQPESAHSSARLNRALNIANNVGTNRVRLGSPLRIKIKAETGLPLIAVIRISGNLEDPVTILDWYYATDCSQNE